MDAACDAVPSTRCCRYRAGVAALEGIVGLGGDLAAEFVAVRRWDGDQRTEHPLS